MIRTLAALVLVAMLSPAWAQSMTTPQLQTLCTAVKANPTANAFRVAGNSAGLDGWLNASATPAQLAWHTAAPQAAVRQAPNYNAYDDERLMGSLLRRQLSFLGGEGLDFGFPALQGMLDQFAGLGILTPAEAAALRAIGWSPAPVTVSQVSDALNVIGG